VSFREIKKYREKGEEENGRKSESRRDGERKTEQDAAKKGFKW